MPHVPCLSKNFPSELHIFLRSFFLHVSFFFYGVKNALCYSYVLCCSSDGGLSFQYPKTEEHRAHVACLNQNINFIFIYSTYAFPQTVGKTKPGSSLPFIAG